MWCTFLVERLVWRDHFQILSSKWVRDLNFYGPISVSAIAIDICFIFSSIIGHIWKHDLARSVYMLPTQNVPGKTTFFILLLNLNFGRFWKNRRSIFFKAILVITSRVPFGHVLGTLMVRFRFSKFAISYRISSLKGSTSPLIVVESYIWNICPCS